MSFQIIHAKKRSQWITLFEIASHWSTSQAYWMTLALISNIANYLKYNYFWDCDGIENVTLRLWKFSDFCSRHIVGVAGDDIMFHILVEFKINHYSDVSNHRRLDCLFNRLFRRRSKKTSKLRVTGLCEGNSLVTCEFSAQMASNAENVSIWWRHHGHQYYLFCQKHASLWNCASYVTIYMHRRGVILNKSKQPVLSTSQSTHSLFQVCCIVKLITPNRLTYLRTGTTSE